MRARTIALGLLVPFVAAAAAYAASGLKLRPRPAIYDDGKGVALNAPEGVAIGGTMLAVSDSGNGRILTYKVGSGEVTPLAVLTVPEVPFPQRIQVAANGEFLVIDGRSRKIARLAPNGKFKGFVETGGSEPLATRSIRLDRSGRLFVLDVSGPRVLVLDPSGKRTAELALPARSSFFSDLAVDPRGNLYLLDSLGQQVYVVRNGTTEVVPFGASLGQELELATSLAVDTVGRLYLLDQYGAGIVSLGPDGSFQGRQLSAGWKEGYLRYPADIAYDAGGTLFVADRANNRVQVFAIAP